MFNGKKAEQALRTEVIPKLARQGIQMEIQVRESLRPAEDAILATTAHSFKGHDAELVVVFAVNGFALPQRILHHPLYVAMTRARSMLWITGHQSDLPADRRLLSVLKDSQQLTVQALREPLPMSRSELDALLVDRIGHQHADWIAEILQSYWRSIDLSPVSVKGCLNPIPCHFHLNIGLFHWVCVDPNALTAEQKAVLDSANLDVLEPGGQLGGPS